MTARLIACLACMLVAPPASAASASRAFTARSYVQIVRSHAGRPLIVHFWSMTCEPCRAELATLGALHRRLPAVAIVLINVEPFSLAAQAVELRRHHLGDTEQWHVIEPLDERLRFSVDPTWQGDIPRTLLISPRGQATRIQGPARAGAIEDWLRGR